MLKAVFTLFDEEQRYSTAQAWTSRTAVAGGMARDRTHETWRVGAPAGRSSDVLGVTDDTVDSQYAFARRGLASHRFLRLRWLDCRDI